MSIFESYEERTLNYKMWFEKAKELELSAEALVEAEATKNNNHEIVYGLSVTESVSHMPQIIMLYAFSIENYLKGIMALNNKIVISKGKTKGLSHQLAEIMKCIGIKVDSSIEEIIDKYTRHILWEGRYPAPLKKSDLPQIYDESNVSKWPNTYVFHSNVEISRNIISGLKNFIDSEIEK